MVELGASLVIGSTLRQFVGFKGYDPPWPPIKCPILRDRILPEYIIWWYIHQHQRWSRCPVILPIWRRSCQVGVKSNTLPSARPPVREKFALHSLQLLAITLSHHIAISQSQSQCQTLLARLLSHYLTISPPYYLKYFHLSHLTKTLSDNLANLT